MGTKVEFAGTVVRAEPGGFGIVHFDKPIGPEVTAVDTGR
jgi:hypothetical protein